MQCISFAPAMLPSDLGGSPSFLIPGRCIGQLLLDPSMAPHPVSDLKELRERWTDFPPIVRRCFADAG